MLTPAAAGTVGAGSAGVIGHRLGTVYLSEAGNRSWATRGQTGFISRRGIWAPECRQAGKSANWQRRRAWLQSHGGTSGVDVSRNLKRGQIEKASGTILISGRLEALYGCHRLAAATSLRSGLQFTGTSSQGRARGWRQARLVR